MEGGYIPFARIVVGKISAAQTNWQGSMQKASKVLKMKMKSTAAPRPPLFSVPTNCFCKIASISIVIAHAGKPMTRMTGN